MKIGIVQQHNTADVADNMRRLAASVEQLAQEGAQLVVLQELHNSLYFCQTEDVANFDLAEPIPGPSTHFMVNWRNVWASSSSRRSLSAGRQVSITIRPW